MKNFFLVFLVFALANNLHAQPGKGGTPLSMNSNYSSALQGYVPQLAYTSPDVNALQQEDRLNTANPNHLFRIGALVNTDINFYASGTTTTMTDGRKIWRLQIRIPGAKALGLYYDQFYLPQGARMYLYNANNQQVLGAYTNANNTNDGYWANEKLQGEIVNMEIDMEADVDPATIKLHIDNVAVFYQAVAYLDVYSTPYKATSTFFAYGSSSPCEVNAVCPQGDSFSMQRKASVHIEYISGSYVYAGSGTMLNNTAQDCTPYMLTASHVEPTNDTANKTFTRWIFYFNYEAPTCVYTGAQPTITQTMVGGYFRARASYDSSSSKIVGDFLLLQLKTNIPSTYGAYLAGWDHSGTTPSGTSISFHHPSGDDKKLSTTPSISPNGNFNHGGTNTHWQMTWTVGGTEEGSSGGGLFDPKGRLIGDLSGGGSYSPSCTDTNSSGTTIGTLAEYSKFSLNWLYTYQTPSSAATRLKDWLDPAGTGVTTLDAAAATCAASAVPVEQTNTTINLYPNPVTDKLNITVAAGQNASVGLYDLQGKLILETVLQDGNNTIDMQSYNSGIYFIKLYKTGSYMQSYKIIKL